MLLKYFYDEALAQASYLVACQQTGEALIIDPARDITPYREAAARENLRITHIAETHIHADFVSGARELAAHTGATLYLSALGGEDWSYAYGDGSTLLLGDNDVWHVGKLRLQALHTPGHTPEHLSFMLTDTQAADLPMAVFTGDFLFVGDIGRPDLLDTMDAAAAAAATKEVGARQQFANIQRFHAMPDYLQILPGHGAGSVCGKALGAVPSTTLGYEKLVNPAFQFTGESAFVDWLLSDQPEAPRYFARMKHVNKHGAPLLRDLPTPERLEGFVLNQALRAGALVIDARGAAEYRSTHVPGTLSITPTDKFSTYAGEFINYDAPTYLIAHPQDVDRLIHDLRAIGVDNLPGYFPPHELGKHLVTLASITPEQLAREQDSVYLLDVRSQREYDQHHIPNAHHIPLGNVATHLDSLPRDQRIVVHCASGVRSQIAASLLQNHGFTRIANLDGGIDAWQAAQLPTE